MSKTKLIAAWLAPQVTPRRVDDRWVAELSVEMIGLGEGTTGHGAIIVTHCGRGEERADALRDLAAQLEGAGLVDTYRGGVYGVRGLCLTEVRR